MVILAAIWRRYSFNEKLSFRSRYTCAAVASTSSASVNQNAKHQLEKKNPFFRSNSREIFFYITNREALTVLCLTNRFQVAVRLFSNRSQWTSKCGKNKKWHTRRSRVCHGCSYHITRPRFLAALILHSYLSRCITVGRWSGARNMMCFS